MIRRAGLFLIFVALLLSAVLFLRQSMPVSAETPWQDKVDTAIFEQLNRNSDVQFIVTFTDQADVGDTAARSAKAEKGAAVFEALSAHASQTQADAIDALTTTNATYQSYWIANYIVATGSIQAVEAVASLNSVERVTTNTSIREALPELASVREPNMFTVTWGISRTQAVDVWQTLNITGTGAVIGGQDTGYDWDHESLIDSYRGWDGSVADHNYSWHDSIHEHNPENSPTGNSCGFDSPVPCDDLSHGTHTMGTMAGGDKSPGNTSVGVAPGSKWVGCRNMERGWGQPSTYLECFQWFLAPTDVAGNNPNPAMAPHVINNSWHCPTSEGCSTANFNLFETAVANLRAAGVVVVVSASNNGNACSTIQTPPPAIAGTFAVGSIDQDGDISSFSAFGPVTIDGSNLMKPDIAAPGRSVYSTVPGGYGFSNGTSMAGPHVAGVVGLMVSANPDLAGEVAEIERILRDTATPRTPTTLCGDDTAASVPNNVFGSGEVNALAAVQAAIDRGPTSAELTQTNTQPTPQHTILLATIIILTLTVANAVVSRSKN